MNTRSFARALLLGATALAAVPAAAQNFTNFIVFGDSLVDTGQFVDPGAALGAVVGTDGRLRFTNRLADRSFGEPYSQILSNELGFGDLDPSQPATFGALPAQVAGLNYAVGGYGAQDTLNSITAPNGAVTPPLPLPTGATIGAQVNDGFLVGANAGRAAGALALISAGGNDIRRVSNVEFNAAGGVASVVINTDAAANTAAMQTAAAATAASAQALADAGAALIIVPNSPNLGNIPENAIDVGGALQAFGAGTLTAAQQAALAPLLTAFQTALAGGATQAEAVAAAQAVFDNLRTQASVDYNTALTQNLAGVNGNVVQVDVNSLFNQVLADPTRFGLADIDQSNACFNPQEVSGIACTEDPTNGINNGANPLALVFNDGIHPTIVGHAMAADLIMAVMQGPKDVALMPYPGISLAQSGAEALESAGENALWADAGAFAPFVSVQAAFAEYEGGDATAAGDSAALNGTLGATYTAVPGLVIGAGLGYGYLGGETAGGRLDYSGGAFYGGGFAAVDYDRFFGGVEVLGGLVSYEDIERTSPIGAAVLRNEGDSEGTFIAASAQAGARLLRTDSYAVGPIGRLDYVRSSVDGYTESGDPATAMRFGETEATSTRGAIGGFFEASGGNHFPTTLRVEALYAHEFGDGGDSFTASPAALNGGFTVDGREAGDGGFQASLKLALNLGFAIASLDYTARLGDDLSHGGGATVNIPF